MTIPCVGSPKIVQCRRYDDGRLGSCAPGGRAYDLVIHDLDTYADLARPGLNGCHG